MYKMKYLFELQCIYYALCTTRVVQWIPNDAITVITNIMDLQYSVFIYLNNCVLCMCACVFCIYLNYKKYCIYFT